MHLFPSAYNEHKVISKEYTGPLDLRYNVLSGRTSSGKCFLHEILQGRQSPQSNASLVMYSG